MKSGALFKLGNFHIHWHHYINEFNIYFSEKHYKSIHIWHLEFIWFRPKHYPDSIKKKLSK